MTSLFISVPETARLLSVAQSTVWRLLSEGEIASFKHGKRRLIKREDLVEWVNRKVAEQNPWWN